MTAVNDEVIGRSHGDLHDERAHVWSSQVQPERLWHYIADESRARAGELDGDDAIRPYAVMHIVERCH